MTWEVFEFSILGLFALGAFFLKLLFSRLDQSARMLIELKSQQAVTHEQVVTLFKLMDKLEKKVEQALNKKG